MEFFDGIAFLIMIVAWGYSCNLIVDLTWRVILHGYEQTKIKG